MTFDKVCRGPGEDIGAVALVALRNSVVLENRIEVVIPGRIGWLADAPAIANQRFLEALIDGSHRIVVAQVPLAEDAGAVPGKWHLGDNYPMRSIDQGFQESLVCNGGGVGQ